MRRSSFCAKQSSHWNCAFQCREVDKQEGKVMLGRALFKTFHSIFLKHQFQFQFVQTFIYFMKFRQLGSSFCSLSDCWVGMHNKIVTFGHKCTLAVPKFILSNFGNFYQYVIWHHIVNLHKIKVLGLQKVTFGGPGPGRVRAGDVRLVR